MYRIAILPAAKADIEKAAAWYKERSEAVSEKFRISISREIDQLQDDLIVHSVVYEGLSRVFVKHFPFQIYFKKDVKRKVVVIFAVLHNKQSRSLVSRRI